jgi:hypothetical protein
MEYGMEWNGIWNGMEYGMKWNMIMEYDNGMEWNME